MSHHFIQFSDVYHTYPNGYEALRGISFRINHGEKVALIGLNGAGKSTLLLHTNGLLLPTKGEVNVGDVPITPKTLKNVRRAVGMVFQNSDDQLFMPTVEEDVAFGPLNMNLPAAEVERRIEHSLRQAGALDLRKRSPGELSGGQKRRVAIATVLAMEPDILILDEPTSNLDWGARKQLIDVLRGFSHTCMIATHDINLIKELCPRTIMLEDGRIVADTLTERIFSDEDLLTRLGLR